MISEEMSEEMSEERVDCNRRRERAGCGESERAGCGAEATAAAGQAGRERVKRVSVRMTVGEYHAMAMLARRGGFGTIAAFLRSAAFVLLHDLRLAADGYVPSRLRDTPPDDIEGEVEAMFRECEDGGWSEWPADINRRR